jgi:hypothetical protein
MKEPFRALLLIGVQASRSYHPEAVLPYIEDQLTIKESRLAEAFLGWCHEGGRAFGHANLEVRFREFRGTEIRQ